MLPESRRVFGVYEDTVDATQLYFNLPDELKYLESHGHPAQEEKPTTPKELIDTAIEINIRHYERAIERQGQNDFGKKGARSQGKYRRRTDHGDPMELDATQRQYITPAQKLKHLNDRATLNCGRVGHRAQNC
jgi:hypothetical protein